MICDASIENIDRGTTCKIELIRFLLDIFNNSSYKNLSSTTQIYYALWFELLPYKASLHSLVITVINTVKLKQCPKISLLIQF